MQPHPRRCLLLTGLALMLLLPLTVRSAGTLELNRASSAELESLPGIGPAQGQRIEGNPFEGTPARPASSPSSSSSAASPQTR